MNGQLNIFLKASEEDGPPETGILTPRGWTGDVRSAKGREGEGTCLDSVLLLDCVKRGSRLN